MKHFLLGIGIFAIISAVMLGLAEVFTYFELSKETIQNIQEELKGTKNISNVKSAKKRILIPKIKNMEGETINTRKGIANVFAEFYAKLYEDDEDEENKKEKEAETCTETRQRCLQSQFQSSRQVKFKKQLTASKEGSRRQQWSKARTDPELH